MKTTVILRNDLVRRAKAQAALRGQSLSRYMEDSLERCLKEDANAPDSVGDWISALPKVPQGATAELNTILTDAEFRQVDPGMWK